MLFLLQSLFYDNYSFMIATIMKLLNIIIINNV